MKFNWGHGIFLTIIICSSGILLLVYLSYQQKIDLVTEEYYPKELVYEDQISKIKNSNALAEKISIERKNDSLLLTFPKIAVTADSIKGEIWFYFPSDKAEDKKMKIEPSENFIQSINLSNFKAGKYEIIFDWRVEQTKYFQKELFLFQN